MNTENKPEISEALVTRILDGSSLLDAELAAGIAFLEPLVAGLKKLPAFYRPTYRMLRAELQVLYGYRDRRLDTATVTDEARWAAIGAAPHSVLLNEGSFA